MPILEQIEQHKREGWKDAETHPPENEGVYETIIHKGSISPKLSTPTKKRFRKGSFPRMDWDYVVLWREI